VEGGGRDHCQEFSYCFGGKKSVKEIYNARDSEDIRTVCLRMTSAKNTVGFSTDLKLKFFLGMDQITSMAHFNVLRNISGNILLSLA
jgi:hypothetical protein